MLDVKFFPLNTIFTVIAESLTPFNTSTNSVYVDKQTQNHQVKSCSILLLVKQITSRITMSHSIFLLISINEIREFHGNEILLCLKWSLGKLAHFQWKQSSSNQNGIISVSFLTQWNGIGKSEANYRIKYNLDNIRYPYK